MQRCFDELKCHRLKGYWCEGRHENQGCKSWIEGLAQGNQPWLDVLNVALRIAVVIRTCPAQFHVDAIIAEFPLAFDAGSSKRCVSGDV